MVGGKGYYRRLSVALRTEPTTGSGDFTRRTSTSRHTSVPGRIGSPAYGEDLENPLATHLLDGLFEAAPLLPLFQERQLQSEADIYSINREGDVIFELKRGVAGEDAVLRPVRTVISSDH